MDRAAIAYSIREERIDLLPLGMMTDSEKRALDEEYKKMHPVVLEEHEEVFPAPIPTELNPKITPLVTLHPIEILESKEEPVSSEALHELTDGLIAGHVTHDVKGVMVSSAPKKDDPLFANPIESLPFDALDSLYANSISKRKVEKPKIVFAPVEKKKEESKPVPPKKAKPSAASPVVVFSEDNMPFRDDDKQYLDFDDETRYLVLTSKGYYAGKDFFTDNSKKARVFLSMHDADEIAKLVDGKVVRL